MTEPNPNPPPNPNPNPNPPPAAWHAGADAETLGFWQNKGLDLSDPLKFATGLTTQYRNAESLIGAPPDRVLKMPKPDAPEAEVKAFWQRLGAPADAKEYDFAAIKHADGNPIAQPLADAIRSVAATAHLPKDAATAVATAIAKHLDNAKAEADAGAAAKLTEEKAALAKNWGTNADINKLTAMQGAKRLGVTPEDIAALEKVVGYSRVMEMFRKVGAGTNEDTFVESRADAKGALTREAAIARKTELSNDESWRKRFLAGDVGAVTEMRNLDYMIAGIDPAEIGRAA